MPCRFPASFDTCHDPIGPLLCFASCTQPIIVMYPTHYLGQFYCYVHAMSTIGSALFFCTTSTACPPRSPPFLPFLSHFPTLRPFRSRDHPIISPNTHPIAEPRVPLDSPYFILPDPIIVCHDLLLHCCRPTHFGFHISDFTFHISHFTFHISHSTFHISHFTFRISHFTFHIRHPTFKIRHSTSDIQDPTFDIRHSRSDIRHPTFKIRHSTSDISHFRWHISHCALSCGIHAVSVRSVLMELLAQV
ncbi:hypothetical protein BCR44DRAFT_1110993 [Catenaria anguillulae PL171]|uniref:Uncharacterized protein n=1 Tax=Catenaria anguillulae PL171 TaxID=765915 RepID=A0A1Y2HMS6_9FUNG|nr:hypothetical protein BCR44DRAFT_1110993 [Catenaria anguillulae PL171]